MTFQRLGPALEGEPNISEINSGFICCYHSQKDGESPCVGCQMHFVPTFDEADEQDSIPGVNLTIVPLGAIFIFLIFFCCKTFRWAIYDFRERDDNKELQVMTSYK